MKVCFIYKEDYPWDVRVEKIVETLAAARYDVVLGCQNLKGLPRRERLGDITIVRMPHLGPPFGLLSKLLNAPIALNPVWLWLIWKAASLNSAETIIVRDLPLMPVAILVGKLTGRRVVFDMAECYPEMYASIVDDGLKNRVFKNPAIAGVMEKFSVRHADLVMVMIEESYDRLLAQGVPAEKIRIVSNTPPLPAELPDPDQINADMLRLLYVGFVTKIRGIDLAVRGIAALRARHPKVQVEFDIVGSGEAVPAVRKLIGEYGLDESVRCHGWCEQEFVDRLYGQCNVGVLTYVDCPHWNHTIPNKIFDYMLAGYPVLTTGVKPISRIVSGTGCGVVCREWTADAVADALEFMLDPVAREKMGRAGQQAVTDYYNWGKDTEIMLAAFKKMETGSLRAG